MNQKSLNDMTAEEILDLAETIPGGRSAIDRRIQEHIEAILKEDPTEKLAELKLFWSSVENSAAWANARASEAVSSIGELSLAIKRAKKTMALLIVSANEAEDAAVKAGNALRSINDDKK